MSEPRIEIVGIYKIPITEDLFREQFEILYGYSMSDEQRTEAEEQCREQLSSIVLIEALIQNRNEHFSISDFTQPQDGVPRDNWQVAYAEVFLTFDGNSLLVQSSRGSPEASDFRVAFFFHFWDQTKPLITSYGDLTCPKVSEMPDRLKRLVSYEPVD
jgi:hypothetical protein